MEAILYAILGGAIVLVAGILWRRHMSFVAQDPEDYSGLGPEFDLRRHLNGDILCEGVIYGPTGRVSSRFTGEFTARWDGNSGTMEEHFRYDSGNTQDRKWTLSVDADGRIEARAADVIGMGTGRQSGPSVCLTYRIRLPDSAGGHVLDVVDWMYLTPGGTIVNRSQFRKFGVQVAELVATMRPAPDAVESRDAA